MKPVGTAQRFLFRSSLSVFFIWMILVTVCYCITIMTFKFQTRFSRKHPLDVTSVAAALRGPEEEVCGWTFGQSFYYSVAQLNAGRTKNREHDQVLQDLRQSK